jgi:hypothetical protein
MAPGNFIYITEIHCERCKYSVYTDEFMELEDPPEVFPVQCRRYAPKPTLAGLAVNTNAAVVWPLVMNTDSCGEYEDEDEDEDEDDE